MNETLDSEQWRHVFTDKNKWQIGLLKKLQMVLETLRITATVFPATDINIYTPSVKLNRDDFNLKSGA